MSFFEELKRRNVIKVGIAYTVVGWLVAQVAEFATENFGAPDWVLKIFVVFLVLGLPLVLVFAWAFEMTPEGLKREKDVDRSESITPVTGQKLNYTIISLLAVALVYFVWESRFAAGPEEIQGVSAETSQLAESGNAVGTTPSTGQKSIAVLPFVNMSADADNEYFSDGISEELLNVLAKVSSLHVASRTSAFAYKGKEMSIGDIARALQVDHVLEGSVRKAGNRVRITAQLIDGRNDKHLWSETYERQLDDIFDIQEEISNAIVDELKVALNVDDKQAISRAQRPTDDTEAYELYLQGRFRWRQRQEENIRGAIGLFEQAIERDPEFAVAYEALAAAYGSLSSWSNVPAAESMALAVPYAERALELNPRLSEARAIMAEAYGQQRRWSELNEQYQIALSNTPNNPTVLQWYGEILRNLGYMDRALDTTLQAYEFDPASPVLNNVIMDVAVSAGRDELALKHWKIAVDLGVPEVANRNITPLLLKRGDFDRLAEMYAWHPGEMPLCVRARQDASLMPELLTELRAVDPNDPNNGWNAGRLAGCLALAGELDAAMDILEPIALEINWYVITTFWEPVQEAIALRQSDRFKQMVTNMGLVEFWREQGWPDFCRPLGEDDFQCE